jgi:uncharacterized membrane protein
MKNFIKSIKILHLWLHFLLIFAFSLLPLLTNVEIITSFVYLPLSYLALAITSLNIENKLNKYLLLLDTENIRVNDRKCLIYPTICCLHS